MTTSRMADEIGQIPALTARFAEERRDAVEPIARAVRAASSVTFAARGTSDHAALFGRYLFEIELGLQACLATPSAVTRYGARRSWAGSLLVAISQSGRSPDLVAYTEHAGAAGAATVAITNDPESPLAGTAGMVLELGAGPERAVAATKTYVLELVALSSIAAAAGSTATRDGLQGLPESLERSIVSSRDAFGDDELVSLVAGAGRAVTVARGFNYANALETALKLAETAGVFAVGYSAADFAHGPVALCGPDTPVVAFRAPGPTAASVDDVLLRAAAAGSPIWTVGETIGGHDLPSLRIQPLPPDPVSAVVLAVPGLLLAEMVARRLGRDPDAPPGLTKVTETL